MEKTTINAPDAPAAVGGYPQALEVRGQGRTLYISGQIPQTKEGAVPADFLAQAQLAWQNVEAQLRAADMSLDNLVKVTTFLADRRYGMENRKVRNDVLGSRPVALTVVITGIFDEKWLLEIEGIAAA